MCIDMGLLKEADAHLVTSLSEPLPLFQEDSTDSEDMMFYTPKTQKIAYRYTLWTDTYIHNIVDIIGNPVSVGPHGSHAQIVIGFVQLREALTTNLVVLLPGYCIDEDTTSSTMSERQVDKDKVFPRFPSLQFHFISPLGSEFDVHPEGSISQISIAQGSSTSKASASTKKRTKALLKAAQARLRAEQIAEQARRHDELLEEEIRKEIERETRRKELELWKRKKEREKEVIKAQNEAAFAELEKNIILSRANTVVELAYGTHAHVLKTMALTRLKWYNAVLLAGA
ncbi:hypothetical protein AC249_AIPGENE9476 [Exaiptasia diaphana]|nr:hypothetical protein AC249_AIPGENE9476 [Exaiptasia diaphana]